MGWYHSHPGIGAFFSGVDRSTQASFFGPQYCLGLLVDPVARRQKLFFGAESTETSFQVIPGAEMLLDSLPEKNGSPSQSAQE